MMNLAGREIAVRDSGSGSRTILWIHAFPLHGGMFREQLQLPARHLVPDLPGFGASRDQPPARSIREMAELVIALADAVGADRFTPAGVSMGGYIALALAEMSPERVDGLILMDTRETADSPEARDNRMKQIAQVENEGTTSPVVNAMIDKLVAASSDHLKPELREMMEQTSVEGITAALHALADRNDTSAALRNLDAPVLLLFGEEDQLTPPAEGRRMAAIAKRATLRVIPGAGHLACLESPQPVNAAIREFLDKAAA